MLKMPLTRVISAIIIKRPGLVCEEVIIQSPFVF
jgi:hypothetical protein